MADGVNVQIIMQEIRERIRQRAAVPPPLPAANDVPFAPQSPELSGLETAVQSLAAYQPRVGELPPQPPSLRGRFGGWLVKSVRRMLFWYTPSIRNFNAGVVAGFEQQLAVLKSLTTGFQQNGNMLLDVQSGLERLEQSLAAETRTRQQLAKGIEAVRTGSAATIEQAFGAEAHAREHLAERLEAETAAREHLARHLEAETAAREHLARHLEAETGAREHLARHLEAETGAREHLAQRLEAETAARELRAGQSSQMEITIQQLRAEIAHQSARISILLEEVRSRTATISGGPQPALSDQDNHKLDGFYAAFEERFRGGNAEIAERLRFYLPWLEKNQIGTSRMPVLDLGCGRGEWLQLLNGAGLEAYGVDTNHLFVADCRERGLRVHQEDALQHLRSLPDGRLGAVTGFHIIEHLPLDILIKLIDETVRVLKPGGLAIFETPNPQNMLVGSHNFYLDPTHIRPIPCLTAQFLLEARGLCNVEIVQLHPYAEAYRVPGGGELAQKFNECFYGPQDYAVIGRRV